MTGIVTLSLVPLRKSESECSEMCSQLLFGERIEILEMLERWLFVRNFSDNYTGWVDRKMIQIISSEENERLASVQNYIVSVPLLLCKKKNSNDKMYLPGGSLLPTYVGTEFIIGDAVFVLNENELDSVKEITSERLISLAMQYLNAPYLWGGKTLMGIDCSGLVQVVYAMCGIQLPRDASQQVECGQVVSFLSEVQAGDLAFFENADGKIVHVGILLNANKIIHASGCVKIENVDAEGIISGQTGEYTHKLRIVKRII